MVALCRSLAGNAARLASYFRCCQPALILTLGNEVAAYARGYSIAEHAQKHLYQPPGTTEVFGTKTSVVHVAHPGIFVRRPSRNHWVETHNVWCATEGKALVERAVTNWRDPI